MVWRLPVVIPAGSIAGRSATSVPRPLWPPWCRAIGGNEEERSRRAPGSQLHRQQQVGGSPELEPAWNYTEETAGQRRGCWCSASARARGSSMGQSDDSAARLVAGTRLEAVQELDGCVGEAALGKGTSKT